MADRTSLGKKKLAFSATSAYMTNQMVMRSAAMKQISVADAKAQLSGLVEQASSGETVCITRRGTPVARLAPIERPRRPVNIAAFRSVAAMTPWQDEGAGDFMRRIRDNERY
jgi:prevent-host-death family protein